jgi:Cu/Ag efflux protein CusF
MRQILTPLVAGLMLLGTAVAYATDATDSIKAVDNAAHTITLNDGKVYTFPASADLSALKAGDKVKITFTTDATGKNTATAIAPAG